MEKRFQPFVRLKNGVGKPVEKIVFFLYFSTSEFIPDACWGVSENCFRLPVWHFLP